MKKLLSISIILTMAVLLCACSTGEVTPTPTTEAQAPVSTPAPTTDAQPPVSTLAPTTEGQDPEYIKIPNEEYLVKTGDFYRTPFDLWPFSDNGTWSARAFLEFEITIENDEMDLTDKLGTDEYEYKWQMYYFEANENTQTDGVNKNDLKGPYTPSLYSYYTFPNTEKSRTMYRLAVGECPEGQFVKDLQVGKTYGFYIVITKTTGEKIGEMLLYDLWNEDRVNCVDVYYNFWENHDRSLGITSGIHKVTGEDRKYAQDRGFLLFAKPVIYLYPEKPTEVSVKLDVNGELGFTYPKYNNGWSVTAYPDGTLVDKSTGREYSYLFWDAYTKYDFDMTKGFVVKGEDTAEFLQQTLSKIGLTPREYNEMIVYWLPLMENNKYNLITFQTEEYTENAKLYIDPKPDSLLRVFMTFKSLDEPIEIEAPEIVPFERQGFTVVEWGGAQVG